MADSKVTDLGSQTNANIAPGDLFPVVDVSDTSMAASGTDKKMTATEATQTFGWNQTLAVNNFSTYIGLAANMPRNLCMGADLAALTSQTLLLTAINLPIGLVVSKISFYAGGTAVNGPQNQWFCLCDTVRTVLAKTADDTSTAWSANARKTLSVATDGSNGSISSYTIPATGMYYLGILVRASSAVPTLRGNALTAALGPTNAAQLVNGTSTGSLTTPSGLGATAGAITATVNVPYCEVA